ncbi:MAG: hypothetical protein PHV42_01040 [Candidatus Pacebacteria bacterium]|nr:hypothetical protein [Candidatus Paceibacterota bacterium]
MKIIQVIPIGRGFSKEILSYFTALPVAPGALVEISVRTRKVPGLVVSAQNIGIMKSEIKSLPFGMRKVERALSSSFFTESYLKSAKLCAEYYATTTGNILGTLIPKILLENIDVLAKVQGNQTQSKPKETEENAFVIQAEREERFSQHRSIIREEFAKSSSVYCCLPTVPEAKFYFDNLSKGIEVHSFFLWGGLSKKGFLKVWQEAMQHNHPVLIVGTSACLSLSRQDIGTIIVEEESSRSYKTQRRPYLDIRIFAEIYARTLGARYIVGDILLRIETLWRHEKGELKALGPIKWKSSGDTTTILTDMKAEEAKGERKFHVIGDEVMKMIENAREYKKHIFLFASRKGYAPSIICRDCRNPAMCEKCLAPIAFYKGKDENSNFFLCHRCKNTRTADTLCRFCSSWRLDPSGIGIDRAKEELEEKIAQESIFTVDKEKTKTPAQVKKIISSFKASEWGVLLGTEAVFSSLTNDLDSVAILSLDSLFAIPDFRINEKIMHIVFKMRSLTEGNFIIQTRNPSEGILKSAREGNILDFYHSEILEREKFKYPPFSILIEISLSGGKISVQKETKKLEAEYLKDYKMEIFPAFIPEAMGTYTLKAILRIPQGEWPKEDLKKKLSLLPPFFTIKIDPESIL